MPTGIEKGDWVAAIADPNLRGQVKRVAKDGSWADINMGDWTKRMKCAKLINLGKRVGPDAVGE